MAQKHLKTRSPYPALPTVIMLSTCWGVDKQPVHLASPASYGPALPSQALPRLLGKLNSTDVTSVGGGSALAFVLSHDESTRCHSLLLLLATPLEPGRRTPPTRKRATCCGACFTPPKGVLHAAVSITCARQMVVIPSCLPMSLAPATAPCGHRMPIANNWRLYTRRCSQFLHVAQVQPVLYCTVLL